MATVNVTIRMDENLKKQADELMSHGYQLEYTNNECYVIRL